MMSLLKYFQSIFYLSNKWSLLFWSIVVFIIQFIVVMNLSVSALWAEDYNYLNRAIYIWDWSNYYNNYPFRFQQSGILYQILISPWVLFSEVYRLKFVWILNILLYVGSCVFLFKSIKEYKTSSNLLDFLVIATCLPLFLFTSYVMTENLLFFLIAVQLFYSIKLVKSSSISSNMLFFMFVLVVLTVLTRPPGMAIIPGFIYLLFKQRSKLPKWAVNTRFYVGLIVSFVIIYIGNSLLYDVTLSREVFYTKKMFNFISNPIYWGEALNLIIGQFRYLFIGTFFWAIPVVMLFYSKLNSKEIQVIFEYSMFTIFGFLFFALVHLIQKIVLQGGDSWFIYGRYNDPALILLLFLGVLALRSLRSLSFFENLILFVFVPLLTWYAMVGLDYTRWTPVNQCGLSIFANDSNPIVERFCILLSVITITWFFKFRKKRVSLILISMICYQVVSLFEGANYTLLRASNLESLMEPLEVIEGNDLNTVICYDLCTSLDDVPRSIKRMMNVYRAMVFNNYPSQLVGVDRTEEVQMCDYLITNDDQYISGSMQKVFEERGLRVYKN